MSNLTIRCAVANDAKQISDFICEHFNDSEPIQAFHYSKVAEMDPPPGDLIDECIAGETLLLAVQDEKLVGVLIACEITSDVGEKDLEYAKSFGPKGVDVFELLSYISDKADVCNKLNVTSSHHIHILSVHQDHLSQGIATKLFAASVENGRAKNFPAVSVDCTSHFTSLIAEKFDMKCISSVTFDEYNKHLGKQLFIAVEPHTEIKTYAKLYAPNSVSN
jgi:GNAT superfamily N-acetyltransferase